MKVIVAIVFALLLSACSSPYTYYVEPTPIKKETTLYSISEVNVNLTLGHGAIPGDESFADEEELQRQFTQYLELGLKDEGILAQEGDESLKLTVNIDYNRKYNYGGKSLNRPVVSHNVTISSAEEKLAGFKLNGYTPKYPSFLDIAVLLEVAAFSWDQEDEPKDIEIISQIITKDIAKVGS